MTDAAAPRWQDRVLDFWFGLAPACWWRSGPLDGEIRARFGDLWGAQRTHPPERFATGPHDALAAVILFDQFPRNMFRGEALSFATDGLARAIARAALTQGFDQMLDTDDRRMFLFMPFEHSEDAADQERSVALFTALGMPRTLDFALKHRAMIARFGRFPSRNAALGRPSTAAELAAGCPEPF